MLDRARAAMRNRRDVQAGTESAKRLSAQPWQQTELPADADVASLLHAQEKALLYYLARHEVDGSGCIVDAGPLIGGSTAPLSAGLRDNPRRPVSTRIRSYDLFLADATNAALYQDLLAPVAVGDDLLPRFQDNVGAQLLERVDVFQGDLMDFSHDGTPIEILFIDLGKSWELNDHLTREFFPSLIPGHSIVIQQDWVHEWLPWLHITMELLADHFAFFGTVPWASASWVCTKPIALSDIPVSLRDEMPPDRMLALFDQAMARVQGEQRGVLEVAKASLYVELDDRPAARALLHDVQERHPDSYLVQTAVTSIREGKVERAHAEG